MKKIYYLLFTLGFVLTSCNDQVSRPNLTETPSKEVLQNSFEKALRTHLDAVENKDTIAMQRTIAPDNELFFLQPERELSATSTSFMNFHKQWFKSDQTDWSIKFKIIKTRVVEGLGIAVVECLYEEPDRDGKPYYNRLHVTYAQKQVEDKWYVMLDHAASIEKSIGQ